MALFGMPSDFAVRSILSEGDAARGFDRLEAQRPIRCGSRKNDAEGLAAAVRRQVAEKGIDRHIAATCWPRRGLQDAIGNAQIASRRNHVNMIGLRRESRLSLPRPAFCWLWKATR